MMDNKAFNKDFVIAEELKNAVNKGKTVLVITHDEELIAECCDYRLNLNEL